MGANRRTSGGEKLITIRIAFDDVHLSTDTPPVASGWVSRKCSRAPVYLPLSEG